MLTGCRSGARQSKTRRLTNLIDRIRHDIQQRLDQLLAEAERLRHALAALDTRERSTSKPRPTRSQPAAKTPDAPKRPPARTRTRTASTGNGASGSTRTAPGQTKAKVLAALSSSQAFTAGEVAKATGVARGTVSTTLSKLSQTGEVVKADRGYRLPGTDGRSTNTPEVTASPTTGDS